MLNEQQKTIIKATVPLLETGGETLTRHFYQIMLGEFPQVRPLFNQAHQASGDQPRALANSVLQYARHIDDLAPLGALVGQIVHKHVSLQVLPEHYPIVGSCLLRAIREVLGAEIATDAVLEAWGAAYQQLADLLIAAEESVYAGNAQVEGGWRGVREFRIARKVVESEEISSFYLQPVDGAAVPLYQPGQYLGLQLEIDGEQVRRNYSLSSLANGRELRISVKREAGGKVSGWLHEVAEEGSVLQVYPPAGDFVLPQGERPLALITAGVGITPALAMLQALAGSEREVRFIHFARHGGVHAFRDEVADLVASSPQAQAFYCYSEPRPGDQADAAGLISPELLQRWLPDSKDIDVCFLGPKPFMAAALQQLQQVGVPAQQCRYEFFGPAASLLN